MTTCHPSSRPAAVSGPRRPRAASSQPSTTAGITDWCDSQQLRERRARRSRALGRARHSFGARADAPTGA
eukprot:4003942-Prymnesium_polylepis.1